jgi:hypothetical protein
VQLVEPFAFVLDHPPIVCRDATNPVTFDVPIANRSADVVRFHNFGCDCGCTSALLRKEELQAGESEVLRMTVNLSGREGSQRFACHWNDESGRRWSAETRVTIYRPAQFAPNLLRLGQVAAGDQISKQVHYDEYAATVHELPPATSFSISSIYKDSVQLGVSQALVESLGVGLIRRRTTIDVSFTVANRGGYTEVFLTPSAPPVASLRIDWSVRETVEMVPPRLALTSPVKGEDRQTQMVRVRTLDGQAIAIERITTSDAGIQARVPVAPHSPTNMTDIEVSVTLTEGKRLLAGDVILHLRAPDSREVRIPVTALRLGEFGSAERP